MPSPRELPLANSDVARLADRLSIRDQQRLAHLDRRFGAHVETDRAMPLLHRVSRLMSSPHLRDGTGEILVQNRGVIRTGGMSAFYLSYSTLHGTWFVMTTPGVRTGWLDQQQVLTEILEWAYRHLAADTEVVVQKDGRQEHYAAPSFDLVLQSHQDPIGRRVRPRLS